MGARSLSRALRENRREVEPALTKPALDLGKLCPAKITLDLVVVGVFASVVSVRVGRGCQEGAGEGEAAGVGSA